MLAGYKIITATYNDVIYAGRWRPEADGFITVLYRGGSVFMPLLGRNPAKLARLALAEMVEIEVESPYRHLPQRGARPRAWV